MYNEENKIIYFKTIIQGKLEFGTKKTFDKIISMFSHRLEKYYRNIVIIEAENIFNEDNYTLYIKRHVAQATDKSWRNTAEILEYCAQFAVSGMVGIWMTDKGQILKYRKIVPKGDKTAVQHFIKGRTLYKKGGKHEEAIVQLDKAIAKYDRHAYAYEIRAYINSKLGKLHDAKRDFNKCLSIDENIPHAYFGRAQIALSEGNEDEALMDLVETTKRAIALQPIFWKARKQLAEIYLKRGELDKAEFELKFYGKRDFKSDDPNYQWKRWALFNYGILLLEKENSKDGIIALDIFNEAISLSDNQKGKISNAIILRYRGLAKKTAGKRGYIKDLKEAVKLGDKGAALLLSKK